MQVVESGEQDSCKRCGLRDIRIKEGAVAEEDSEYAWNAETLSDVLIEEEDF
jgi:hypothetical protein